MLSSSFFPLPPGILSCSAIFLPLIFIPLSRPSLSSRPYLVVEARSCRNQSFFGLRTLSKEWKSRRGRISTEVDFLIEIEIEIEVSSRSKFRSRSRRSRSARRSLVEVQVQTEVYSKSKSRRSRSLVEVDRQVEVSSKSKPRRSQEAIRSPVEVEDVNYGSVFRFHHLLFYRILIFSHWSSVSARKLKSYKKRSLYS